MRFACESCGHPAVSLPAELRPDGVVRCQGCGASVGTWAEFKTRATQAILHEHTASGLAGRIFAPDPLDLDTGGPSVLSAAY
ncbi:MAG TPA: hypothetical protein VHL98_14315 [Microvirga sp.]|nr:hypothetical protein [Microvirga sp.]